MSTTETERLSPNAKVLLNLLAFFDPDSILPERLIWDTKAVIDDEQLGFLFDESK